MNLENQAIVTEENPLVSICIPAYNHEKFVAECIHSVIDQDYKNIELIIINDGSTDRTDEIIRVFVNKCQDRFVRFEYRNRENKGLCSTMNESVEWAEGKYFSVIASDDFIAKNKISLLSNKLESLSEDYAVAFGNADFIDNDSKKVYIDNNTKLYTIKEKGNNLFLKHFTHNREIDYKDKKVFGSYKTILAGNYLPAMSYLIKLEKIIEVGAWTNNNILEDWELWLKLSKFYKFVYIDKVVASYRWHENNSGKLKAKKILLDSIQLLEKEKSFALSNGYEDVFYRNLITRLNSLRKLSKKEFLLNFFNFLKDKKFRKHLLKKILNRLFK